MNALILNPRAIKTIFKILEYETIQAIITYLPRNYTIRHVKSHQDDSIPFANLTLDVQVNVQADKIFTAFATKLINNHISIPSFTVYFQSEYTHHRIDKKFGHGGMRKRHENSCRQNINGNQKNSIIKLGRKCDKRVPTLCENNLPPTKSHLPPKTITQPKQYITPCGNLNY